VRERIGSDERFMYSGVKDRRAGLEIASDLIEIKLTQSAGGIDEHADKHRNGDEEVRGKELPEKRSAGHGHLNGRSNLGTSRPIKITIKIKIKKEEENGNYIRAAK